MIYVDRSEVLVWLMIIIGVVGVALGIALLVGRWLKR
jgi:hypothetical protein